MDSVIKGTLSEFTDNITLCGVVEKVKGRDAIQRNLDRFERWTNKNLMKFNKMMCKVLYLHHGNPRHTHRLDRQCKVIDELGYDHYSLASAISRCIDKIKFSQLIIRPRF
ncbi:hypothetical protein TURU_088879 [Turdus rufiventris]|nr:hypothetical protein TURU_088879 [Turdus rufiventris]